MEEINVEKIMKEIRDDIREKNLKETNLHFGDTQIKTIKEISAGILNISELNKSLQRVYETNNINVFCPLQGKGLKLFVKKAVRKCVRAVFMNNIMTQNEFNENVSLSLKQINLSLNDLERRISILEEDNCIGKKSR